MMRSGVPLAFSEGHLEGVVILAAGNRGVNLIKTVIAAFLTSSPLTYPGVNGPSIVTN